MYTIRHSADVADLELGRMDLLPWGGDYKPEAMFKIGRSDKGLVVWLRCYEENPVATVTTRNGPVCQDSCMEFFFIIGTDHDAGYFNFEVNSVPTLLVEYGPAGSRCFVEWPMEDFELSVTKRYDDFERRYWQVRYVVPFAMIGAYMPGFTELKSGDRLLANLYKTGFEGMPEHYLTAFPVDTEIYPEPNFHSTASFAEMAVE